MAVHIYPINTRRAVLRLFSDGVRQSSIKEKYKVDPATFRAWAKSAEVIHGSRLSNEELEERIENWRNKMRARDVHVPEGKDPQTRRQKNLDRHKFGPTAQEKAHTASLTEAMNSNPEEYKQVLAQHFDQANAQMSRETTMEGQMNAMWAGYLLTQMRGIIDAPPPVTTMADVERIFKMFRTTFGMDDKKGGATEAADLRILTAKVTPRTVIEAELAEHGKLPPPK